jgi:uncharacterized protein YjbI with pentapeptide repeats/Tfp pilus assembly protein PilZ
MTPSLPLIVLFILGITSIILAGYFSFKVTGIILNTETYNRNNAKTLLQKGRPEDWNAFRDADSSWIPNLRGIDLSKTNLKGANLRKAILDYANMEGSNLDDADLTEASLVNTNLSNTSLKMTCFDKSNLKNAKFINEDISDDIIITNNQDRLSSDQIISNKIDKDDSKDRSDLINMVYKDSNILYTMSPIQFEELIALILKKQGFIVELTSRFGDGGFDILLTQETPIGKNLFVVETKRFSKENLVGLNPIRALLGVVALQKANKGMFVTTSSFTKAAKDFANKSGMIELVDFNQILIWLNNIHIKSPFNKRQNTRKKQELPVTIKGINTNFDGKLIDISEGGICIKTSEKIRISHNEILKVDISNHKLNANVVWEKDQDKKYIIGLEFTNKLSDLEFLRISKEIYQ